MTWRDRKAGIDGKLAFARDPLGDLFSHFLVLVVEHHLGAIPAGCIELHGGSIGRHHDW